MYDYAPFIENVSTVPVLLVFQVFHRALLSQIPCLWVKIVAIAYQAETLRGNILSCLMVMKTSEVVGKLSMLV